MNAEELKLRRENLGITQKKLAEILGVSTRQVQALESGERDIKRISFESALKLARIFDVPVEELAK